MRTVTFDLDNPEAQFVVLLNAERQYSLWPADLSIPGGWDATHVAGARTVCEEYLEQTWTDLRPATLQDWAKDNPT